MNKESVMNKKLNELRNRNEYAMLNEHKKLIEQTNSNEHIQLNEQTQ